MLNSTELFEQENERYERYLNRTIDANPALEQIKGKRHTLPNGYSFESGWTDEIAQLTVCLEDRDSISVGYEGEDDWTRLYLETDLAQICIGLRPEQMKQLFNALRRELRRSAKWKKGK